MGYKVNGVDVLTGLVNKESFFDIYPSLSNVIASPALWGWGNNSYGQLGDNTTIMKLSPVQTVAGGTNWKQVSNTYHTIAIKTDGTLWTWGYNSVGELGNNSSISNILSPAQTVSGGTNWKQCSAGEQYSAAIKTDGTLWTWGTNSDGRLGDNTRISKSSPVQTVTGGTNWKQVSCGGSHTSAIKTDGTLWTWGYNLYGQLGNNSSTNKSSPVQTVAGGSDWKQVSAGSLHTTAIKTDGTLWSWGYNFYGQLGDNTSVDKSSPVQTVAGGTNWKQVSVYNHTIAIKTDGTLWSWGFNTSGQLGDNTSTNKSSPIQTVAGGTNWKQVSCGFQHSIAIKTDGTVWSWGRNDLGSIGDNTTTNRLSPVQTITGGTNWKQVSGGFMCSLAIAEDDPFL